VCALPIVDSLRKAVAELVHDGDVVALEGFSHLVPFAAAHEIIRQGKRDLTIVRMAADIVSDQLVGTGCVRRLVSSWIGNPGVGSLHRVCDALQKGIPRTLELEEYTHDAMASAYVAGAAGLPLGLVRGVLDNELSRVNPKIKRIECPFTGESIAAVPAIQPDLAIVHAQEANGRGDVLLWGIVGVQKEAVLAAKRSLVTVERIVDCLEPARRPNAISVPHWAVSAVVAVPRGAEPSYAMGSYARDDAFFVTWDRISCDKKRFDEWISRHVFGIGSEP
jgi:glutaconate CoA-transferase subunit A